jgi:hypothetical protein
VEYIFSGFDCSIGNFTKIYCSLVELLFFKQTHKIGYRFYEMMQSPVGSQKTVLFLGVPLFGLYRFYRYYMLYIRTIQVLLWLFVKEN